MANYNLQNSGNLNAVKSDGTIVTANFSGAQTTWGCTLSSSTTYYFPIGGAHAPVPGITALASSHFRWDASIIVTLTLETTNFPRYANNQNSGLDDVTDYNSTAGFWMQEAPTTWYASGNGAGGLTVTTGTLTVAGGTAGGTTIHLGNLGTRRARWKAVVGGTGGLIRHATNGKLGD